MAAQTRVELGDIYAARRRIAGVARRTPLIASPALAARAGGEVRLKLEFLQDTGSFKVRGAANTILSLDDKARAKGVVTVSTGNHGRAVAHVARLAGVKAAVCLSNLVPENKRAAIRALGAELVVHGQSQDDAAEIAFARVREAGMTMVNPFDDARVVTGQGTIGIELLEDWPEIDVAVVPLSGGGLVSGIACALKAARAGCRVVAISMDRGAAMHASIAAGKPVQIPDVDSLADSLQGGIFLDNKITFAMVRELVDEIVLVTEEEIARGMAYAFDRDHLALEGAAAVGYAAILAGKLDVKGQRAALVLSGTNVASGTLAEIVAKHRDWLRGEA